MLKMRLGLLSVVLFFPAVMLHAELDNPNTDWLSQGKYGIGCHYLKDQIRLNGSWSNTVASFNTARFASDVAATGAKWVIFTLGQNSGYYCAPNRTLDGYSGARAGVQNSSRDLPADLYRALNARGIKLMLYIPSGPPTHDPGARIPKALGVSQKVNGNYVMNEAAVQKWTRVIQEWSDRWGSRVAGWWFDGYKPEYGLVPAYARYYHDAVKHGNPRAIFCLNPGSGDLKFAKVSDYEDYTAGEHSALTLACLGRWYQGIQWHVFVRLASGWYGSDCQFANADLINYIKSTSANGGASTWNMSVTASGSLGSAHLSQMKAVKAAIRP